MKKLSFVTAFLLVNLIAFAQSIPAPKEFKLLEEVSGDLDKDQVAERVLVYDTPELTEDGAVRELRIFKNMNGKWSLWKSSTKAILKSDQGGVMGEPFQGIKIVNGVLLINHSGGSSWKWFYTDKYRLKNGVFELIGYSSTSGKPCEYWQDVDFNLATGKLIYKKTPDPCEGEDRSETTYKEGYEEFFEKNVHLNLNNRFIKDVTITSPKNKFEIYL